MRKLLSLVAKVVCLIVALPPITRAAAPTAASLLKAHRASLDSIHELDVEFDFFPYAPRTSPGTTPSQTYRWTRAGATERVRWRDHVTPTRSDGRPDNILDLIHDGKECRFLRNWDPEKPQRIDPAHQGSANAVVMPDSTDYRTMPDSSDPGIGLFLSFARAPGDDHWNLDELGRKSPSVKLLGQADVEGVKCYHLRLAHPADPGKRDRSYYDVFLDPSAGFLVRKSITHVERGDPGTGAYNHVAIVTKFRECKPGVFFPVEAHIEGTENTIARTVVRKILLNDPLPRDALDFTFPKHILVRHYPPDKGVVRTEIWGDNNVALKEYKSPDDIAEWVSAADFTAAGNWSPWMHGGILVLLAVFVAVLMIRRARA